MSLQGYVNNMLQNMEGSCKMKVGKIIDHPDGYKVKIIDGQFLSNGRVSNTWSWKKISKNGKLSKKTYHGYGW